MNFRKIIILILPVFFLNCGLYYSLFKKESTYYNVKQKSILVETTSASGYGYGFDSDLELDYILVYTMGKAASEKNADSGIQKIFRKYGQKDSVDFFEKIYTLREITLFRMAYYEKKEKWKEYTYIKKYLLPPLENYSALLEKNLLIVFRDYRAAVETRKKEIASQVREDLS